MTVSGLAGEGKRGDRRRFVSGYLVAFLFSVTAVPSYHHTTTGPSYLRVVPEFVELLQAVHDVHVPQLEGVAPLEVERPADVFAHPLQLPIWIWVLIGLHVLAHRVCNGSIYSKDF